MNNKQIILFATIAVSRARVFAKLKYPDSVILLYGCAPALEFHKIP